MAEGTVIPGDRDIPGEHGDGRPHMRGKYLPHQQARLTAEISNVEDCQKPSIATVSFQMEVLVHACNRGVSDIRSVEERKEICEHCQCDTESTRDKRGADNRN
jgi:hypothetical protein